MTIKKELRKDFHKMELAIDHLNAETFEESDMARVYFLMDGADVVYVGSSWNVASRVKDHKGNKTFDSVKMSKPMPRDEALMSELQTIVKYQPKYNLSWNESSKNGFTSIVQYRNSKAIKPSTRDIKKCLFEVKNKFTYGGSFYFLSEEMDVVYNEMFSTVVTGDK